MLNHGPFITQNTVLISQIRTYWFFFYLLGQINQDFRQWTAIWLIFIYRKNIGHNNLHRRREFFFATMIWTSWWCYSYQFFERCKAILTKPILLLLPTLHKFVYQIWIRNMYILKWSIPALSSTRDLNHSEMFGTYCFANLFEVSSESLKGRCAKSIFAYMCMWLILSLSETWRCCGEYSYKVWNVVF